MKKRRWTRRRIRCARLYSIVPIVMLSGIPISTTRRPISNQGNQPLKSLALDRIPDTLDCQMNRITPIIRKLYTNAKLPKTAKIFSSRLKDSRAAILLNSSRFTNLMERFLSRGISSQSMSMK